MVFAALAGLLLFFSLSYQLQKVVSILKILPQIYGKRTKRQRKNSKNCPKNRVVPPRTETTSRKTGKNDVFLMPNFDIFDIKRNEKREKKAGPPAPPIQRKD
jgi:hypothetical protein